MLTLRHNLIEAVVPPLELPDDLNDFQVATVKARAKLINYEEEAVAELGAALVLAQENIRNAVSRAYIDRPPEDWNYTAMLATGRLTTLQAEVVREVERFNVAVLEITRRYSMYGFIFTAEVAAVLLAKYGLPASKVFTLDEIDALVQTPIAGTLFVERLFVLDATVKSRTRETIAVGLTSGEGPNKITAALMKVTEFDRYGAETITRTAVMHGANVANIEMYIAAGYTGDYRRLATLDKDTCLECYGLDREILTVEEARNVGDVHPRCR